jgi:hypothetical protein
MDKNNFAMAAGMWASLVDAHHARTKDRCAISYSLTRARGATSP